VEVRTKRKNNFWEDNWLGKYLLKEKFPKLHFIPLDKDKFISD